MEEALVQAVVGATVQVLVQNLASVSMRKIKLVRDFKKDLDKLTSAFVTIQHFLCDIDIQQVTSWAVKQWLRKLEEVAVEADNVLDEFNYELRRKERDNMEAQTRMKKKVMSLFQHSNFHGRHLKLGNKIRDVIKKLELINQEASSFGLQMRLVASNAPSPRTDAAFAILETSSCAIDPIFLGRDNDVSRVVEMLTSSSNEQVFSVLPIVGTAGLGKTTLARKVYHDKKIRTHFQACFWVHVSTNFDPITLFKRIISSLRSRVNVELESREVLLKELKEVLEAKRFLLVLDNVRNQDQLKWEEFVNSLSGIRCMKGNGIIVTTRIREVASIVQTLPIYELKGLSEDDCWWIIKAKTFGEGDIPSEFETIGRNIARRCRGLPLAANVLGEVLRGKSRDEWLSSQEKWLSEIEGGENYISKILKLGVDNLPSPIKKCFAYCSIFPEDHEIGRKQVIELWMAEGFLQADQRDDDMETVGNKIFDLLLHNSLLQEVKRDGYGNIKHCSMHGLVRDLACSVLGSKAHDNISDCSYQARRISCERNGDEVSPVPREQAKCLRTLFFKGEISDTVLSDFKCLHVLTLTGYHVKTLPSSIRKLIHLRYLNIAYTSITYLPDSIGKLYHMQTLRAKKGYFTIKKLPSTLKYLTSLRHLCVTRFTELPPEVGRLTSLQTLPHFQVGDEKGYRIVELGSLQNLKGKLKIYNLEKVHDKEEAKGASLFRKPNISELEFVWSASREGQTNDENVLEGLQPHPNLKILKIHGFKGASFPLWTLKMAVRDELESRWIGLNNLMEIRLSSCNECQVIPTLGQLPHLRSLYLWFLTNLRSIGSSFYGIDNYSSDNGVHNETKIVFPALKRLTLSDMSNLREWVEVEFPSEAETQPREVKVFPCLEYLQITNCKQLMSAPSHFPCLKELYVSNIESCLPLSNICGINLMSLTKLEIEGLVGLVCLPDWLFSNNQNLSVLEIRNCPNLRVLPDDLNNLSFLEDLVVECCPNLKSIPCSSGGQSPCFTSLRRLLISNCEGLINLPCELVESCAPSLERLSLQELSSLTNLPMVIGRLHKMPRLMELEIINVPRFINGSSIDIGLFRSLQQLTIGPASDSPDYVSFQETLDGILRGSQWLRRLKLIGMEHWDTLHDQLQYVTDLSELELHYFGMEALPEWFGNLSSLETLTLFCCEKLRRLPSTQAMRRLNKLARLEIQNCPLLQQRCIEQQSDDSEWPKICRIPNIIVDGRLVSSHHW